MQLNRKLVARLANFGLLASGLAMVVILGTGGTRITVGSLQVTMRTLANPLQGFALAAALRLLAANRHSGLEARFVAFFARQGLPPRDSPARLASASRAGALLGLTWGLVCAVADVVHFWLTAPAGQFARDLLPLTGIGLAIGAAAGTLVGALLGALTFALGRLWRRRPGRYQAGRWCLAALWAVSPALLRFAPEAIHPADRSPGVLLGVAASVLLASALLLAVVPAAILRARRGRWGLAVVAAGGLALAVTLAGVTALGPAAGQGPARDSRHPNILIFTVPGLRLDVIGAYRDEISLTPNVDALAARGSVFLETVTPATEGLAAAGSLLSGAYPESHGVREALTGSRWPPGALTERLAAHGYETGAFVSTPEYDGRRTGLDALFERYDDLNGLKQRLRRLALARMFAGFATAESPPLRPARETAAAFERWLSDVPPGPWFAWVQFADASRPEPVASPTGPSVTAAALGLVPTVDETLPVPPAWAAPELFAAPLTDWLSGYDECVRRTDAVMGEVIELLLTRGEVNRTLIVVLAEHGLNMGEGGVWFDRGPGLAEGLVHVPWVVSGPGVTVAGFVPGPSSLVDVAPTLLGLVGLGGGRFSEGEDLSRYVQPARSSARSHRSGPVFAKSAPHPRYEGRRMRMIRIGPWKLVRVPGGQERLYYVGGNLETEVALPRGRAQKQMEVLSDVLSRRLARQARLHGDVE